MTSAFAPRGLGDLLPGDVGFSTIGGRAGGWVSLGQALLRDECIFTHAYLVLPDGWLIEAMPGGARIVRLDGSDAGASPRWGPGFAYGRVPLTDTQRGGFDRLARLGMHGDDGQWTPRLVGRPYGFDDYLALALWEWRLPGHRLVREKVRSSNRMICSQLVDFAWCAVGFHLFVDGRLAQDVTPGALFWQTLRLGQVHMPAY